MGLLNTLYRELAPEIGQYMSYWLKAEAISSSGMFVLGALATGRGYLSAEE